MELFNEVLEFVLAHREEGYEAHTIVDNVTAEFLPIQEELGVYIGIQQHGKHVLILTFVDNNNKFRVGSVIDLEDYVQSIQSDKEGIS
tara:strand:+ start:15241 stop:15504 length:264 start_codon:yes stop_codon:yes gene_type:complete